MRAALYARVSTSDQDCAMQLRDLRRYVEIRGWTLVREFVDTGVSGGQRSRPELDALMADVKRGKFDVVLVWRFDRMARSTSHLIEVLDTLRAHGCDFCSTQEQIETCSAAGRLMFTIIAAFAEFEKRIIQERTRAGMKNAKLRGAAIGRPRTFGNIPRIVMEQAVVTHGSQRKAAVALGMPLSTLRDRLKITISKGEHDVTDEEHSMSH